MKTLLFALILSFSSVSMAQIDLGEFDLYEHKETVELQKLDLTSFGYLKGSSYKLRLNVNSSDVKKVKIKFPFRGTHVSCALWGVQRGGTMYCIDRDYNHYDGEKTYRIRMQKYDKTPEVIEVTIKAVSGVMMGKPFTIKENIIK
jgi:hypothetical protein